MQETPPRKEEHMVIQHNMAAQNSARMQKIVSGKLSGLSEKLSSGYKINRGADDAAGLAISEKMRFQARGLNRGSVNIEEGVGYCQVADGALSEMHDMLQRMNELCVQAANGTLSSTDRGYVDDEIQQLKAEIQRTCWMTQFNEEYIFRCTDVIPNDVHDVYMLNFSGKPTDLFIYNESYDNDNVYAGVVFRGRRYTWDEISPNMYDKTTHQFRKGDYSIRSDDDNTLLTLHVEEDGELPQVSRIFRTSADGRGIYVNEDLAVEWDKITNKGGVYSFDYHGMTISFTPDSADSFDDMVLKMTGTVWESEYEVTVASKALDAQFNFSRYDFKNNDRVAGFIDGNRTKYILHAVDGNKGGTIPVWDKNGKYLGDAPFDGIWLEGTDDNWNPTNQSLYAMSWGKLDLDALKDRVSAEMLEALKEMKWGGENGFGFGCDDYTYRDPNNTNNHPPYCDWGNLSADIWVGSDIKKDPNDVAKPYPPEAPYPGDGLNDPTHGNTTFWYYDKYNEFLTTVLEVKDNNQETVRFNFSVINEISKEDAVNALNNIGISYGTETMHDTIRVQTSGKVNSGSGSVHLTLEDEYKLGRDYENGKSQVDLTGYEQLSYSGGKFSVTYAYDSARGGGTTTFSGGSVSANISEDYIIQNGTISGGRLKPGSTSMGVNVYNMTNGNGSSMSLNFSYNYSDFFGSSGAQIVETKSNSGKYVKVGNRYQLYHSWNYPDPDNQPQRYNVSIKSSGGKTLDQYLKDTVYPGIANGASVQLATTDYPDVILSADEHGNSALVTRYQTPFQHDPIPPREEEKEKPEYLLVQCSSNSIDNIAIQKQRLSLYRLGLSNVATLSEMQATGNIDIVGAAIAKVSAVRSLFGAYQNRLERAYDINRNTHENTQRAESTIRDTDMAEEIVKYSNQSILQQSANAMLAQANQANQGVLTLLR